MRKCTSCQFAEKVGFANYRVVSFFLNAKRKSAKCKSAKEKNWLMPIEYGMTYSPVDSLIKKAG